jgi:hypothetical protein
MSELKDEIISEFQTIVIDDQVTINKQEIDDLDFDRLRNSVCIKAEFCLMRINSIVHPDQESCATSIVLRIQVYATSSNSY